VLEQGDLAGLAVVLELDGLLGPGDLPGPAAGGDDGQDGQAGGDGEGSAAVGDPVHVLVAAVPEHLRVGAAAVEPEHDLRSGAGGFLQLGQGQRQGDGQAGGLAGDEAHGAAVVRGDVGVGAAFLRPAALVVPAFRDGFRASVRDEVVIDVVHAGQDRVGGKHRGGERGLQPGRVGRPGDRRQAGPHGPLAGQRRRPGQRPGLAGRQVLELLDRRGAEREADAGR